jgi:formylglycine-generating enzyme required for sulfatase activity
VFFLGGRPVATSKSAITYQPPGMQRRPFFKTCVDKYEYPNKEGSLPQGNLSYTDAQQFCAQQGKRICTAEEWQWTCSSLDAYTYPYCKTLDEKRCNSDASQNLEASGARINCFSRFGAFDMVGNIFEWVTTSNKQPALMGWPLLQMPNSITRNRWRGETD